MKSRKTPKRSTTRSSKAQLRKKLFGRGHIEKLEDRSLMASDGLVYPLLGLQTGKINPNLGLAEYTRLALAQANGGSAASSSSGMQAEGAGATTTVNEAEPNNIRAQAQFLNLGTAPGNSSSIAVVGNMTVAGNDEDYYSFNLRAGDILDLRLVGSPGSALFDVSITNANNIEMAGSTRPSGSPLPTKPNLPYPANSPLSTTGDISFAFVTPATGTYYARVAGGTRTYTLTFNTYRPVLESQPAGFKQKLFLDFDGAQIRRDIFDTNIATLPTLTGIARLSPLSNFLAGWGLNASNESQVITSIVDFVKRTFDTLKNAGNGSYSDGGGAGRFDIEILNSRDNPDVWGQPGVSRVIVGGTSAELGIGGLLGIAQSVDVGNFALEETAVVLLDQMLASYGGVQRAGNKSLIDVLVSGIGNTIVHEAGHFFGGLHVDDNNTNIQIMDTVGLASDNAGAGPDRIFGTADDILVPFGTDVYDATASSIQFGNQNTGAAIAWGLSTGTVGGTVTGSVFLDNNFNRIRDTSDGGLGGITVFADLNGNGILESTEPKTLSAANGFYSLVLAPGTYLIRQQAATGYQTTSSPVVTTTVVNGQVATVNFANNLVNQAVTGFKWNDTNGNGLVDAGEPRLSGVWIYIDLDNDNKIDLGEPSARTGADGSYTLRFPSVGTYAVREVLEPGFVQTFPGPLQDNEFTVTVTGNAVADAANLVGLNFGNRLFLDLGDAPISYGTLRVNDGAAHGFVEGLFLGINWDAEQDGNPTATALGDDNTGLLDAQNAVIDDEDGISFGLPVSRLNTNQLLVTATNATAANAYLQVWIDLNQDGDFADQGEQLLKNQVVPAGFAGTQAVTVPALGGALLGNTYLRARLSYDQNLGPTKLSASGEVEDYLITVVDQQNLAVNDGVIDVPRGQTTIIDVLANDFVLPGQTVTISGLGASNALATIFVTTDNKISYTPPQNFVGPDFFQYTITVTTVDSLGNVSTRSSSATVRVNVNLFFQDPKSVDDFFDVPLNAVSFPLAVLANDIQGQAGNLTITSVTRGSQGGQVDIATGGQSLRYTPVRDFTSSEQFTYTAQDPSGKVTTSQVTVQISPVNADGQVKLYLVPVYDTGVLAGQTITGPINQNDTFRIDVYTDDLRTGQVNAGLFSAYMDVLYNIQLVSLNNSTTPGGRFDFDVTFDNNFTNLQLGTSDTPGLINDFGAFRVPGQTGVINNAGPVRMATLRFTARSAGIAKFSLDPADDPPETDTILFNTPQSAVPFQLIDFVGTSVEILGDSVQFPTAVDDSYTTTIAPFTSVPSSTTGNAAFPLTGFLANDRKGSTGAVSVIEIQNRPTTSAQASANSSTPNVSLDNNGTPNDPSDDRFIYRPPANFTGLDSFTYTIGDSQGARSTATITVLVGSSTATSANDDVALRLKIYRVDAQGNDVLLADGETVPVGTQLKIEGTVQDLRNPFATRRGVFAAFEDILYDSDLVSVVTNTANRLGFQITYGTAYDREAVGQLPVISGDIRTPGLINDVGVLQVVDQFNNSTGSAELTLFKIAFTANKAGTAKFIANPADNLPQHDTLLFQPPTPVIADRIFYGFDSVTIVAAGGGNPEGNTNPNNAFDVNADGVVTAFDVLNVINQLNTVSQGLNAEGEVASTDKLYADVNADGSISAIDALLVINYLNSLGASGEGEGEANLPPAPTSSNATDAAMSDLFAGVAPEIESPWKRK